MFTLLLWRGENWESTGSDLQGETTQLAAPVGRGICNLGTSPFLLGAMVQSAVHRALATQPHEHGVPWTSRLGALSWSAFVALSAPGALVARARDGSGSAEHLLGTRVLVGLVVDYSARGRCRHPQRSGQLGQRQLGRSEPAAPLFDLVDDGRR